MLWFLLLWALCCQTYSQTECGEIRDRFGNRLELIVERKDGQLRNFSLTIQHVKPPLGQHILYFDPPQWPAIRADLEKALAAPRPARGMVPFARHKEPLESPFYLAIWLSPQGPVVEASSNPRAEVAGTRCLLDKPAELRKAFASLSAALQP